MALSTTLVLAANGALQVLPQSMPAGCERTSPLPVTATASTKLDAGGVLKLAVTVRACCIDSVQVRALPLQSPPQPLKIRPVAGVAVKVTVVAGSYCSLQSAPQSMPAGVERTLPPALTETLRLLPSGGGGVVPAPPPPPQAVRTRQAARALAKWKSRRDRRGVMGS